jgi:DNA-binding transcriptional ArsR family regulator
MIITFVMEKSSMIPESRLIRSEMTLRDLALPDDVLLARKSLIRWIALSLGLIMPNESRRLLLDILEALIEYHLRNEAPTTRDIIARVGELTKEKQNEKAVYYHLLRLKNMGFLTRRKGRYYLGEGEERSLKEIFRQFYDKKADGAFSNIGTALDKLEKGYR